MSTRSVTRVFNGNEEIATIYRHYDGYPSGHGKDLKEMLEGMRVVNGYSSNATFPRNQMLNGADRVAAYIVAQLWNEGHDPGILPIGLKDAWQDYEYHVICPTCESLESKPDGLPPILVMCDSEGNPLPDYEVEV